MFLRRNNGLILIFALWVLGFLTVLAVGVAAGIRQKILLLEKLDQRSRGQHVLEGSVRYAASYVINQISLSSSLYKNTLKINLHNNSEAFGQFDLAQDSASISYMLPDQGEFYGVIDEERKININTTTVSILSRLIERVLGEKADMARRIAESILDWRQFGESQIKGFFSDEYYRNLEFPYDKKDSSYEILDELLLVKDITKERYDKLLDYITVYGDGKVNINTASREVLYALGLDEVVTEKILQARRGRDGMEATLDDHVFFKTFDVATEVNSYIKLMPEEVRAIDSLNKQNLLTTNSVYFTIKAQSHLAHSVFSKTVRAVISTKESRIIYWKER